MEMKGIQNKGEKIKMSSFIDDMIVYGENHKKSPKKKNLQELIIDFSKVTGNKIQYKTPLYFYVSNENVDSKIKNIKSFIITQKYEILKYKSNKTCTKLVN